MPYEKQKTAKNAAKKLEKKKKHWKEDDCDHDHAMYINDAVGYFVFRSYKYIRSDLSLASKEVKLLTTKHGEYKPGVKELAKENYRKNLRQKLNVHRNNRLVNLRKRFTGE